MSVNNKLSSCFGSGPKIFILRLSMGINLYRLSLKIQLASTITFVGITMTDGDFWQEQRNFAMRHLRNLGFGKSHMESLIIEELQVRNLYGLLNC